MISIETQSDNANSKCDEKDKRIWMNEVTRALITLFLTVKATNVNLK